MKYVIFGLLIALCNSCTIVALQQARIQKHLYPMKIFKMPTHEPEVLSAPYSALRAVPKVNELVNYWNVRAERIMNNAHLVVAVYQNNLPRIRRLLGQGTNIQVELEHEKYTTLLEYAVSHDQADVVDLLIKNHAWALVSQEEKDRAFLLAINRGKNRIICALSNAGARYRSGETHEAQKDDETMVDSFLASSPSSQGRDSLQVVPLSGASISHNQQPNTPELPQFTNNLQLSSTLFHVTDFEDIYQKSQS